MLRICMTVRLGAPIGEHAMDEILAEAVAFTALEGAFQVEVLSRIVEVNEAIRLALAWLKRTVNVEDVLAVAACQVGWAQPDVPRTTGQPVLIGLSELAGILGMTIAKTKVLVSEGKAPEPIAVLKAGPVWLQDDWTGFDPTATRDQREA